MPGIKSELIFFTTMSSTYLHIIFQCGFEALCQLYVILDMFMFAKYVEKNIFLSPKFSLFILICISGLVLLLSLRLS